MPTWANTDFALINRRAHADRFEHRIEQRHTDPVGQIRQEQKRHQNRETITAESVSVTQNVKSTIDMEIATQGHGTKARVIAVVDRAARRTCRQRQSNVVSPAYFRSALDPVVGRSM